MLGAQESGAHYVLKLGADVQRKWAEGFDSVAPLYDRFRPGYPDSVVGEIFEVAGIAARGAKVLEIGCGTGQATLPLAVRGCRVIAVERGSNMAGFARQKFSNFPNVKIHTVAFEEADLPAGHFDFVLAATSFHWLPDDIRLTKPHQLLKSGGWLVDLQNYHVATELDPETDVRHAKFFRKMREIFNTASGLNRPLELPSACERSDVIPEFEDPELFEQPTIVRRVRHLRYSAADYVAFESTCSPWLSLDPIVREQALNEVENYANEILDGWVMFGNLSELRMSRKVG